MTEKTTEPLYAGIAQPIQVRREILLATRDGLALLKKMYHIQSYNDEKIKLVSEIRETLGEIRLLTKRLHGVLPSVSELPKHHTKRIEHAKTQVVKTTDGTAVEDKIAYLEAELGKLEKHIKH